MKSPEKFKVNKSRTSRFLALSLVVVLFVLFGALSFYVASMKNESQRVLNEAGMIYMESMSEKISTHFETTASLRMDTLKTIIANNPPDSFENEESQRKKLRYEGSIRGYSYLAFPDSHGKFHMIYGDDVELEDPEPFMISILKEEQKVAVGHSVKKEDKFILMSVPAKYTIGNGEQSIALAAKIHSSYINEVLSLNVSSEALTYSHIIRRDGTFIIRNVDTNDKDNFKLL